MVFSVTVKIGPALNPDRSRSQPRIFHLLFDKPNVSGGGMGGYMVNLLHMCIR